MRKTIVDIARLSGYSCSTVSRVIAGSQKVHPRTKEKVLKVIKQYNYKPSIIAQGLARGHLNLVALIIGDIQNPFYAEIVKAADEYLYQNNYMTVLCVSNYEKTKEKNFLKASHNHNFAGVIATAIEYTDLKISQQDQIFSCPIVLVNRYIKTLDTDIVTVDNYKGGYLATRHLIELGHKSIAHMAGPKNSTASIDRMQGYLGAMYDSGLPVPDNFIHYGDLKPESGYNYGLLLLKEYRSISAVFAANDQMAIGISDAFIDNGKSIPEDLSLVGYDNSSAAVSRRVKLTTVKGCQQEMGKKAAEIIIDRINSTNSERQQIFFSPSLVVRNSARPWK